ncbi:HET-domain-containing protein [Curvularia clavata]|uniref:HET-domain-containing protein n=1 Tax=Curvularia clavata TaxID=95742 RepID=A0A9Q8Z760_CURCL|nr:HET-domain-containing protein [Curvularia clavata]
MEEYMQALPVERLPKSLKDAIFLTRALGIQYIWIDSLCIIQDCDEDKDREMTRMAKIYKDAVFTISAARARSCDEGFLGVQEQRVSLLQDSIKLPMNCLNGAIGTVLFYPSRQLSRHKNRRVPIDRRAWTYQEQLLSCRVVSFFNDSIEWSCPSWIMCDDGLDNEELGVTDPLYLRSTTPILERTGYLSPILYRPPEDRQKYPEYLARLHKDWWVAVFEYTMGNLTNLNDRLLAIAGIASEFHDITGDVYVAGLWMSDLIRDLQWEVLARSDESSNNRDFKYYAPTWTWASAHERLIRGPQKEYDFDSDRVEVIDCKVDLVSPFAPFGCVHSGELKIRAPLKFLSDREAEEMLMPGGRFTGWIKRDWRSKHHTDELSALRGGTASHIEPTGVWCLGLSKSTHLTYESSGLALEKRADGLFERIGIFQIHKVDTWVGVRTAEQDELWASWGDDYVVTTVTIV